MTNGTGTGGFSIDGQAQTYDVGVEREDESTVPYDPGAVAVDNSRRDISNGTKKTLASYLSKVTLARAGLSDAPRRPNAFPIDATPIETASLVDEKGNTPPLVTGGHNSSNFASDGPALRSRSNDSAPYDPLVRRGGAAATRQNPEDGHNLFQNIALPAEAGSLEEGRIDLGLRTEPFDPAAPHTLLNEKIAAGVYTKGILAKNRFVAGAAVYADTSTGTPKVPDQLNSQQFIRGYRLGSSKVPSDAQKVTFGQLAQVGTNLIVRTTHELGSTKDGYSPSTSKAEANAILPSYEQLGIKKIEMELLQGKSVFEALPFAGIKNEQVTNFGDLSWGALNSSLDQYSGFSSFGMQLLSAALVTAALLTFKILGFLVSLLKPPAFMGGKNKDNPILDGLGRHPLGASLPRSGDIDTSSVGGFIKALMSGNLAITTLLGIRPTENDFQECISRGALAFFGIDGKDVGDILNNVMSLTQNPGYVAVMARSFNRSFLRIADDLKKMVDAFKVGLTSGIKQLLELLMSFKHSRFISSLNVFAGIGDNILTYFNDDAMIDPVATTGLGRKVSRIDAYPNLPGSDHYKNRLKGVSTPTSAWSTATAIDHLLIPKAMVDADGLPRPNIIPQSLGKVESMVTMEDGSRKKGTREAVENPYKELINNRFDEQYRHSIEESLESEYLPFYINDLRTNEIISFHAFLSSLTDGYTATYDSAEAFGRIEAVKIYKNTSRKLDFSFYMVSMSDKDFDYMWTKINKLTTLLYPQFTSGKEVSLDKNGKYYKFSVPFSQVVSAAPMVRVRIGDLVQSNYSKFNLARLFGYPSNTSIGVYDAEATKVEEEDNETAKSKMAKALGADPIKGKTYNLNTSLKAKSRNGKAGIVYETEEPGLPAGLVAEIIDVTVANHYLVQIVPDKNSEMKLADYGSQSKRPEKFRILNKQFVIHKDKLSPTQETWEYIVSQIKIKPATKPVDPTTSIKDFMDEKNNPVSKSFKTVGGRGLAGFIESMNFEWFDRTPWNVDATNPSLVKHRRAPMMCKVSIGFSPIHDITPGIDHHGFNRAPIYPVGPMGIPHSTYDER